MPRDEDVARLQTGLRTLGLWPEEESDQTVIIDEVCAYLDLLQRWNRRHNLTAVRDPAQMIVQHVLDCAAIVPVLRAWVEARAANVTYPYIIDVGSGAGLPGLVLAWLWPQARIALVEPAAKRAAFLQQMTARPALARVQVVRSRIEDVPVGEHPPDAIVCRAFSSLADYAQAIAHLAGPATVVSAMKARLEPSEKRALAALRTAAAERPLAKAPNGPEAERAGDTPGVAWTIAEQTALRVPGLAAERCLVRLEPVSAGRPCADAGLPIRSASVVDAPGAGTTQPGRP